MRLVHSIEALGPGTLRCGRKKLLDVGFPEAHYSQLRRYRMHLQSMRTRFHNHDALEGTRGMGYFQGTVEPGSIDSSGWFPRMPPSAP